MKNQKTKKSAFCIAGAGSGVGKTTITIAILRALKKRGLSPAPFKCGPDYIDPGFHKRASGTISRNLDTWMMGEQEVTNTFKANIEAFDIAVVEGVMGLFDSADVSTLEGSTAHVAKLLNIPILLVVNARGIAGTIAPLVKGFIDFKDGVKIAGIIANNVGSEKHAEMLAKALNQAALPPLLGYLPRDKRIVMPERHLGLVPITENSEEDFYDILAENIEKHFKLDEILKITEMPGCGTAIKRCSDSPVSNDSTPSLKLAIARDDAFHFYYEDNLDMLRNAGFELIPFSPLSDTKLPDDIRGIYLGGGFPECFAAQLAENTIIKQEIAEFADAGGFIYAECGGFMYLANGITTVDQKKHTMCGIIPLWTKMENKLRTLGYREIRIPEDSPLGPVGTTYRGHEFHWSSIETGEGAGAGSCPEASSVPSSRNTESGYPGSKYSTDPGDTIASIEIRDARKSEWKPVGYRCKNIFASYIHAHFASNRGIVNNMAQWCNKKRIASEK